MKQYQWRLIPLMILMLIIPGHVGHADESSDCSELTKMFNTKVEAKGQVCQLSIPRKDINVVRNGNKLSSEMMEIGFMTNFEKTGNGTAVTGEFALLGDEVNPVIDQLRKGKLQISALHNHMIGETPRIFYLHFQGVGDLAEMTAAIKAAIQTTNGDNTMNIVPMKKG